MFEQAVTPASLAILKEIGREPCFTRFYLAGGTALALQIGHRLSVDLDFFTRETFKYRRVIDTLQKMGDFRATHEREHTVVGFLNQVMVSFFQYNYPMLETPLSFHDVSLAGLKDIAAMKIEAISGRGVKRDFVDLYFLGLAGLSLQDAIAGFQKKYESFNANRVHLLKALTYFADAEKNEMPKMFKKVSWQKVKDYFIRETKRLII
ncbi:MAG: nucleotidyl transferase AbiEii/AbiGii toxin family protein [Deltaproteobacteria bacterium]|nr:nucleotidyl transferase AbiEii/AbiGii toxin family protein [Deltaproteobacteria bacterium]